MKFTAKYVREYFWQTRIRTVFNWVWQIALVLIIAFGFSYYFCMNVVVQESSMEPTLAPGEKVLINTATYIFGSPERGDIIAFYTSEEEDASIHIKRVIGLPGETIQIIDGSIYIDGEIYLEDNDFPMIVNPGLAEEAITLGSSEYFVLGDSRNSSEDSRFADVGNVKSSNIVGKLWLVVSPFSSFGLIQ